MVTTWPHAKRDTLDTSVPVVVITRGDQGFGHCIARSLGRLGVFVYGVHSNPNSPEARSRYWRENFSWDIRNASPDESVDWLLQLSRKLGRRPILIPNNDMCCLFVADNAPALREGFLFPNQPAGLTRSLSSKRHMYFLCKQYSIPTAETAFPQSREDVREFLRSATFPVMLKCIDYTALRRLDTKKKAILGNAEAVLKHYDKIEVSEDLTNFMLQEYIPGGSEMLWMFNGYFDEESKCLFGLIGKRFRQYPAYTGMTSLGVCDANDVVARQIQDFMKAIGYRGILDIGHMYDTRTGEYKLLDANPRVGAAFRLFVDTSGLDVVQVLYRDLTGQPVLPGGPQVGRKWVVENYDVVSSLTLYRDGKLGVREWARSFRGVQEACWFTWDDPAPFFSMGRYSLKLVFEKWSVGLSRAQHRL
jgi:D-aspartate ligase